MKWFPLIFCALTFAGVAEAKDYTVKKAQVEFDARAMPGSVAVGGEATKMDGKITEDAGTASGWLSVKIADLDAGIRTSHMKEELGEGEVKVKVNAWKVSATESPWVGEVTLHGVTQPVTGKASLVGNKVTATFDVNYAKHKIAKICKLGICVDEVVKVKAEVWVQ